MTRSGTGALAERLRDTPALHLADQVLSSGTNFLAVVVVARLATPREFGIFSILLVTFFLTTGFNRSVPHAIAMTMTWDDERARSGYFFLPPLVIGAVATVGLGVTFALLDPAWVLPSLLLLPLLLQDAVRMHAFGLRKPHVALFSDVVWLLVAGAGFLLASTAPGAALAWGVGGICALLCTRPWRIRIRVDRRPVKGNLISAFLEYASTAGVGYLTPLLVSPIITVLGVGALQGANVIRGPIILLVQALIVYRMSGPPIDRSSAVREAVLLLRITFAVTALCIPPLFLLRSVYGPWLLGSTWPQVEPLVVPVLVTLAVLSVAFGPTIVVRKMGLFALSAKVQIALTPVLIVFPVVGAVAGGTRGFQYATAGGYAVFAITWWVVLLAVAKQAGNRPGLVVT